jgi:hypothetical protein
MIRKSGYTIVVCTCDAYQDAWVPFFTLLKRYWPGVNVPIVLNTETLAYQHEGLNILSTQLYKDYQHPVHLPWSRRLYETLSRYVDTDLVLLFLEDFFLKSPVNVECLGIAERFIQSRGRIANLLLFDAPKPYAPSEEYPWIVKRSKFSPYLFSLQAGFWRTERLRHFLRDHESPWYFERWGTIRARRYPDEFYALDTQKMTRPIFDYSPSVKGEGLSNGLWLQNTPTLFCVENIPVDLSIRGVMPVGWKPSQKKRNYIQTAWRIFLSLRP